MSTKWKKVVSIIGISAILATNSIGVLAEDAVDGNETNITKEADDKSDDTVTDDKSDDTVTDDKSDDTVTDDKSDDTVTDDKSDDAVTDDKSDDTVTDDKSDDAVTDDKSDDTVTDDKTDDTVTDDKKDDTVTDNKTDDTTTVDETDDTTTDDLLDETATDELEEIMPVSLLSDVQDNGATVLSEEDGIPTELGWSDTEVGSFKFKHNVNMNGSTNYKLQYYLELWKDGALKYTGQHWTIGGSGEYCEANLITDPQYDFSEHKAYYNNYGIKESGTYKYRLKVIESNDTTEDFSEGKVTDFSSEYEYTETDEKLATPQNVIWNSNGVLEWDAVDGANQYMIWMLTPKGTWGYGIAGYGNYTKYDLSEYITDDTFTYIAVVSAKGKKDGRFIYSDYSEEIIYNAGNTNTGVNEGVSEIIGSVDENSTPEQVTNAVTELANQYQGEDKNKLQIAMQSSDDVQAQVKQLDELYAQKANITKKEASIGDGVELDSTKISMIGAALNASEGATVQMNIKKPTPEKDIVTNNKDYFEEKYANAVQFSMDVTGINSSEDLAIPITITMPIPKGLNPDKLEILHEQANGELKALELKVNKAAGIVSFTITHFSEFIFAEKVATSDGGNTSSGSGSGNSSSSSSSSGSSGSSSSSSGSSSSSSATAPKAKAPTIGKSEGWSGLGKEVNEAIAKATAGSEAAVWVNLNDTEIIPESAIKTFAGKNVTVCFVTKTGVIINVNGNTLNPNTIGTIKITSSKEKDGSISLKIRNSVPEMDKSIAIFVKATTGVAEGTLYFVDAANALIPFRTSNVAANGYVAFEVPFVNANYTVK